jgi:hypothetical protein
MDRRYESVTIDAVNSTMMRYEGKPGSGVTIYDAHRNKQIRHGSAIDEMSPRSVLSSRLQGSFIRQLW